MPDYKITDYAAATGSTVALDDVMEIVDLSDTSMDASGTNEKVTVAALIEARRRLLSNHSTAQQGAGFATDTYLTGSNVAIPSGYPVVGTAYRLIFDVVKSAAGTATPILTVRVGTAGSTADTARLTFTFGAGTAAADTGVLEVLAVFRTVGSGTSAVLQGQARLTTNLATTGLSNAGKARQVTSGGFDSTVANLIIGASYNGGTSASHTVQLVRAELIL